MGGFLSGGEKITEGMGRLLVLTPALILTGFAVYGFVGYEDRPIPNAAPETIAQPPP